jgi:hypothetical protein
MLARDAAGRPRDSNHHVSLAVALQCCRRHDEAIRSFMDALALKIDEPTTHFRLGMSFRDLGMKAEAAECLRTAIVLGLDSSDLAARGLLAFLEREACRWAGADEVMASLRRDVLALPDNAAVEVTAFAHAVLVDDPLEQLKAARHYALHVAAGYPPLPRRAARRCEGRVRIGYLSADFHQHPTSQLMAQMLESHDRDRFEVTLLSTGADDRSALRQRLRDGSEHFEDLHGQSFSAMATRIRALGIDILVDLKGATYDTLMPVLAQRPAPLQVSWLGFPGSTGAPFIDYFIGDPVTTPLADAAHFSEKIAQLPHCYQPERRPSGVAAADDAGAMGGRRRRAGAVRVSPVVQDLGRGVRHLVRAAARAAGCRALAAAVEHRGADAALRRGERARRRRRPPRLLARVATGRTPRPPRVRRPLSRRLAVQRAHDRERGALGRGSGRDGQGPKLRPARCRERASHRRPRRARLRRRGVVSRPGAGAGGRSGAARGVARPSRRPADGEPALRRRRLRARHRGALRTDVGPRHGRQGARAPAGAHGA